MSVPITEPTTMLTDYALAALCVYFALSLHRSSPASERLFVSGFAATAVAAVAGGTAHGFRIPLGDLWHAVWLSTVAAIALGSGLLIAAGLQSFQRVRNASPSRRELGFRWLRLAVSVSAIALALLAARVSLHPHFNENDLYHVVQGIGLYALYRAAQVSSRHPRPNAEPAV